MAESNAWWAYGSTYKLGDGATEENFTAVAEVRDITGPNMTRASIDVTNQDGWGCCDSFSELAAFKRNTGRYNWTVLTL